MNNTLLNWQIDLSTVTGPPSYEPEDISKQKQDYLVATIVLGTIVGLALLAVALFATYLKVNKSRRYIQVFVLD